MDESTVSHIHYTYRSRLAVETCREACTVLQLMLMPEEIWTNTDFHTLCVMMTRVDSRAGVRTVQTEQGLFTATGGIFTYVQ